jgi:lipopolysaccharide export system protein LptC
MTEDGATLRLTARSVAPGAAGQIRATEVEGVLETPDGQRTDLSAAAGDFATGGRSATLSGRVVVATSTGYRIETEELHADLTHTRLESPGPVRAEGPPGRIDAGAMVLRAADGAPGAYVLVFNRGVKLIYDPPDTAPR